MTNPAGPGQPFTFNGQLFDMSRIDDTVLLDDIEIWELRNESNVAHPFHIHDIQFYILDRNGVLPEAQEQGRKDVVLVDANEIVRFITQFTDFSDPDIPYMFHCHILPHEDDGMMGQFLVLKESGIESKTELERLSFYPNPLSDKLIINWENELVSRPHLKLYNLQGQILQEKVLVFGTNEFETSRLPNGLYFLEVINEGELIHREKLIKR